MTAALAGAIGTMGKGKPAREPVRRDDRVNPTKPTVKRLTDDPLKLLCEDERDPHKIGLMTEAAEEIRRVYMAVVGALMARKKWFDETTGFEGMPDGIARAHAQRYLPWVRRCGPYITEALIEIIIERRSVLKPSGDTLRKALLDYWNVDKASVEETQAWRDAVLDVVPEKLKLSLVAFWRERG